MSAITSAAAGNWSATGSWTGGVVPVEGDTVQISHRLTLDQDVTIGADTATAAIELLDGGILEYLSSAAGSYTLTLKGELKLNHDNAKIEIGTVASPIGSSKSFTILTNYSASLSDSEYGINVVRGEFIAQGASKTYYQTLIAADASAGASSMTTGDSTGWVNGDVVFIAPTTRTSSQYEKRTLSADASGTSISFTASLTHSHKGTAPIQGRIINTSRNIVVKSYSATEAGFVRIQSAGKCNFDWVQFLNLGRSTTNARGIDIQTTSASSGSANIHYCAFVESEGPALAISSGVVATVEHCVFGGCLTQSSTFAGVIATATQGNTLGVCSFNHIYVVGVSGSSGDGISIQLSWPSFSNVYVAGATRYGFNYGSASYVAGASTTISNITSHSNASIGISLTSIGTGHTVSDLTAWHNASYGVNFGSNRGALIDTLTAFGNTSQNVNFDNGFLRGKNWTLNGSTDFSTNYGIRFAFSSSWGCYFRLEGGDFGTVSGVKTAHTSNDVETVSAEQSHLDVVFLNVKFASSVEISKTGLVPLSNGLSRIRVQRKDQTDAAHITYTATGNIEYDGTVGNPTAPSIKLTPTSSTHKLECEIALPRISDGGTATVSADVLETAAYNGNAPRLRYRSDPALNFSADGTLDTHGMVDDTWETLSGTTPTAQDAGAVRVYIDCDGTAGIVRISNVEVG